MRGYWLNNTFFVNSQNIVFQLCDLTRGEAFHFTFFIFFQIALRCSLSDMRNPQIFCFWNEKFRFYVLQSNDITVQISISGKQEGSHYKSFTEATPLWIFKASVTSHVPFVALRGRILNKFYFQIFWYCPLSCLLLHISSTSIFPFKSYLKPRKKKCNSYRYYMDLTDSKVARTGITELLATPYWTKFVRQKGRGCLSDDFFPIFC